MSMLRDAIQFLISWPLILLGPDFISFRKVILRCERGVFSVMIFRLHFLMCCVFLSTVSAAFEALHLRHKRVLSCAPFSTGTIVNSFSSEILLTISSSCFVITHSIVLPISAALFTLSVSLCKTVLYSSASRSTSFRVTSAWNFSFFRYCCTNSICRTLRFNFLKFSFMLCWTGNWTLSIFDLCVFYIRCLFLQVLTVFTTLK